MWMAGGLDSVPDNLAEPYAQMINGEWEQAAASWEAIGAPYEQAMALSQGGVESKKSAFEIFDELGARPAARWIRSLLKESGAPAPRGRNRTTRDNPLGLTARQFEVYGLITEGLTNAEIADRLFISTRTVENHVSAVLSKLDISNRTELTASRTAD
jgi:DNA-binding NarL/FixJ family response regulator